jgi:hypothetical protein
MKNYIIRIFWSRPRTWRSGVIAGCITEYSTYGEIDQTIINRKKLCISEDLNRIFTKIEIAQIIEVRIDDL